MSLTSILEPITNNSATSVSLQKLKLDASGAQKIAKALAQNTVLTFLDLSHNSFGNNSVKHLIPAIESSQLTSLDLSDNAIGEEGAQMLLNAILTHQTLKTLNLNNQTRKKPPFLQDATLTLINWHARFKSHQTALSLKRLDEDNKLLTLASEIPTLSFQNVTCAIRYGYTLLDAIPGLYKRHVDQDEFLPFDSPFTIFSHVTNALLDEKMGHYPSAFKLLLLQTALAYLHLGITRMQESFEPITFYKDTIQNLREQLNKLAGISTSSHDPRLGLIFEEIQGLVNLLSTDENLFFTFLSILPSAVQGSLGEVKDALLNLYSKMGKEGVIQSLLIKQLSYLVIQGSTDQLQKMEILQNECREQMVIISYLDAHGEIIKRSTGETQKITYNHFQKTLKEFGITEKHKDTSQTNTPVVHFKVAQLLCELQWVDCAAIAENVKKLIVDFAQESHPLSLREPLTRFKQQEELTKCWRDWGTIFKIPAEIAPTATLAQEQWDQLMKRLDDLSMKPLSQPIIHHHNTTNYQQNQISNIQQNYKLVNLTQNITNIHQPVPVLAPSFSSPEEREQAELKLFPWNPPPFDLTAYSSRESIERELFDWLEQTSAMPSLLSLTAFQGMGGVGKTTLAKYLFYKAENRSVRIWLTAESLEQLEREYKKLWTTMHPEDVNILPKDAVAKLNKWLENHKGYFVVYDNVTSYEKIAPYLPKSGGLVLFTTRSNQGWTGKEITIKPMEDDEATKLVKNILPHERDISSLIKELGTLPLMLSAAAHTIKNSKTASISDYIRDFRKRKEEYLHHSTQEHASAYATFKEILDQLEEKKSPALELLYLCAWLNPDDIPQDFLKACTDQYDLALEDIQNYSLFQIDRQTKTFSIHRRVQEVIQFLDPKKEDRIADILNLYKSLLDDEKHRNNIFLTALFLPHLETIDKHCSDQWKQKNTQLYTWLSDQIVKLKNTTEPPLITAARSGSLEAIALLLKAGAAIDAKNNDGMSALMVAAGQGHKEAIEVLLNAGAAIDAKNNDGKTALMVAALLGQKEAIEVLLNAGAAIDAKNNLGQTALMWAAQQGHKEAIEMLLNAGAAIDAKDNNGWTALMWAARQGQKEAIEVLLNAGAAIDAKNNNGWTALMWAAALGHKEVIEVLLNAKADVNAEDKDGRTALMWAAMQGHKEVIEVLIAKADVNAENNSGNTALDVAKNQEIKDLLLEHGAKSGGSCTLL